MRGILYIYLNQKNKLIFKFIHFDNGLNVGDINYYGHKLIYKGSYYSITNKLFDIKSNEDYRNYYLGEWFYVR